MLYITAHKGRSTRFAATLTDNNGDVAAIGSSDAIRLKIGKAGETPALDLSTAAATANGSSMTLANPTTILLAQGDMAALSPGVYDAEMAVVDDSDEDRIKHVQRGMFVLHNTQGGGTGLT